MGELRIGPVLHWRVLRSPSFTGTPSLLRRTVERATDGPARGVMAGRQGAKKNIRFERILLSVGCTRVADVGCGESTSGVRVRNIVQEVRESKSRKT